MLHIYIQANSPWGQGGGGGVGIIMLAILPLLAGGHFLP